MKKSKDRLWSNAAPVALGRRAWLLGAALGWAGAWACAEGLFGQEVSGRGEAAAVADEDAQRQAIEEQGAKVGLRPFRTSRTANYVAVGDAGDVFRSLTLRDCEAVRSDYLDDYRAKGFDLDAPMGRLVLVTLADDRSFAAFLEKKEYAAAREARQGPTVHGVYQLRSNRLVVYDHRSLGPQLAPRAGYENLRSLVHEATHQLTYNTGLLVRGGDVPLCISEGLAVYGELRRASGRTQPGAVNHMRLKDLASTQRQGVPWIAVSDLLTGDDHFRGSTPLNEALLAYAESWLLIHYLMSEPSRRVGLRLYLKAIRGRKGPDRRLDDASASLGDLDRLNRELRAYGVKLQKGA